MKKLALLLAFLFLAQNIFSLAVSSWQDDDQIVFIMDSDPDLEFVSSRVLQQGDILRWVGTIKTYKYRFVPLSINQFKFDKKLQYSRFEQEYVILENGAKIFSHPNFRVAYKVFCRQAYNPKFFTKRHVTARFAYTSYDYPFPFSLLYFFPGPQAFERIKLKLNF